MRKLLYIGVLIAMAFSSCEEEPFVESTPYTKIPDGDPNYAFIKVLNMSPGSPGVNYFVNNVKLSGVNNTLATVNGYAYNGLYPDFGYAIIKPGSTVVDAKIASSATADPDLNVFTSTINLEGGKHYSIFNTGVYNTTTKKIPSHLVVEDVKPALDTSKVFLRIVNVYSGGKSVDLIQQTTNQKLISDVAFNTSSAFTAISPTTASNVYNLVVTETNNTTKTLPLTVSVTKGRAYTFILRGVSGSTTYPLAATSYTTFF